MSTMRQNVVRGLRAVIVAMVVVLACMAPASLNAQQIARASGNMVVTQHHLATDAGVAMLAAGGNAVDAAVAAAFAMGVVDAGNAGIGGRAQILVRAPDGRTFAIDGTTQFPDAWDPDFIPARPAAEIELEERSGRPIGYDMVAVPGTVAALGRVLEEFGTFELSDVLAPSIRYAEDGVVVERGMLPPVSAPAEFSRLPGAPLSLFRPDGSPYEPGELYRQPELAQTLRTIAVGGGDAFYKGEIARRIAEDMAANGGLVTYRDLAQYQAMDGQVVRGEYREHSVTGSYWPASGATVIQTLQTLERLERPRQHDPEWIANVMRAMIFALEDRVSGISSGPEGAFWLTSDSLASRRAREIDALPQLAPPPRGSPADPPGHTTHLSIVDDEGWAVSLTQSLGDSFGSRVMTEGLGFLYAMSMGYQRDEGPGGRPGSSQSPMVVDSAGQVRFVIGAAGSNRIISSIVTTLDRAITFGQPLDSAASAPRIHPVGGDTIRLERRPAIAWPDEVSGRLQAAGWGIVFDDQNYGILHGIAWDPVSNEWVGVADPRGPGTARGLPVRTTGDGVSR